MKMRAEMRSVPNRLGQGGFVFSEMELGNFKKHTFSQD